MPDTVLDDGAVKGWARGAGFSRCGIAQARALADDEKRFRASLAQDRHAGMQFLERDIDKRFNPGLLLPGCRSVVVVTLNYCIGRQPASRYKTARFTRIDDYHGIVRDRLQTVVQKMQAAAPGIRCRIAVDSSCIAEKSWAVAAGVGCWGKNGLVHNDDGSFFVIGIILTDGVFKNYGKPSETDCRGCRICMDKCPAGALDRAFRVDARRCFAYHTIENKDPDTQTLRDSPSVFGCDICQEVCPKNRPLAYNLPLASSKASAFLPLTDAETESLTRQQFKEFYGKSAIARRGFTRFQKAVAARQGVKGQS